MLNKYSDYDDCGQLSRKVVYIEYVNITINIVYPLYLLRCVFYESSCVSDCVVSIYWNIEFGLFISLPLTKNNYFIKRL